MTEVNTGIPVFADSTARDAAFGGSGEKVLAEGQFAFLEDTNVTQFYDGSVWQPVGTQTVELIETLTPSAAATTQFTTGSISSAYSFYTIFYVLSNGFRINLRSGGSTISTANYQTQSVGATTAPATVNSVVSAQTSWQIYDATTPITVSNTLTFFNYAGSATQYPTLVEPMVFKHWSGPTFAALTASHQYNGTQAVDSLLFTPSTGTLTGTIKLYGWV
jgi:hypothetical protein